MDPSHNPSDNIPATLSHGGRFIQYNILDRIFQLTVKYKALNIKSIMPIGEDGYCILCCALNLETNEYVMIKKIKDVLFIPIEANTTLLEIMLLRHMDHENVVAIRDIIPPPERTEFNDVYIAYEFMDTDLDQIIQSTQPLSEVHFQYFLYQILRGLKYIHSANVLHMDLKPRNILVNKDCDLKICGFGTLVTAKTDLSLQGLVKEWYHAPELLLEFPNKYTAAVDIWSVGCIFMELMNRRPLFPGRNPLHKLILHLELIGTPSEAELGFLSEDAKQVVRKLEHYERQSFSEKFPNVDPGAIDLIEKMLKFDPTQRITVEEALAHPYLTSWHDINDEPVCMAPFSFEFEHDAPTIKHVKEIIYKEALALNPEYQYEDRFGYDDLIGK